MFIEVSELLKCPEEHPESYCVVAPYEMEGRDIRSGVIGCPVCRREYVIDEGVATFDAAEEQPAVSRPIPPAETIQALFGLTNPGGYALLAGSLAGAATRLPLCIDSSNPRALEKARSLAGRT